MEKRVLIVEDDVDLAMILRDFLINDDMEVAIAGTEKEAYELYASFRPTLMVLDIMLPDGDGMGICRQIRSQSEIPILMLSAKSSDIDKILSLGLGADEFLEKPYSPPVVVAHVKAMYRRISQSKTGTTHANAEDDSVNEHIIRYSELYMDKKQHIVEIKGKSIQLVSKEFDLLWFLASNPGEIFAKEAIYDAVWGEDEFGEISTVTVHVRKIRAKIEQVSEDTNLIKTIWGVGYRFATD